MQTEETTLNDEAKKQVCATTAYSSFVWRPSQLRKYRDCRRGREPGLSNRIQHCWSRLRQLRIRFVGNLYSSRLFRAQRTISFTRRIDSLVPRLSPRLFYFSSSMYARNDVINFSSKNFFAAFIFEKGLSAKICAQQKFPTKTIQIDMKLLKLHAQLASHYLRKVYEECEIEASPARPKYYTRTSSAHYLKLFTQQWVSEVDKVEGGFVGEEDGEVEEEGGVDGSRRMKSKDHLK